MDIRRLRTVSDRGLERFCEEIVNRGERAQYEQLAQMILILRRTRPIGGGLEVCLASMRPFCVFNGVDCK